LKEKKIGFKRGAEYSEETIDLLKDFAATSEMLNKELENKVVSADDPIVQQILTILDNNLSIDSEFLGDIQEVLDLIQELPDKPTEKEKIGFRQLDEQTWSGCLDILTADGFDSYEDAAQQCCAKCGQDTIEEGDDCWNFCEERCCEIEEPCSPPANGCPPDQIWNQENCHCEYEGMSSNPCKAVFAQLNTASQESTCNACAEGTPTEYQAILCDCCPEDPSGPTIPYKTPEKKRLDENKINKSLVKRLQQLAGLK